MSGLSNDERSKLQRLGLSLTRIQRDVEQAKEQLNCPRCQRIKFSPVVK